MAGEKVSVRSGRKSRRGGGGGGGVSWRQSQGVAIALIVVIIIVLGRMFMPATASVGLNDFPYTFMTEKSKELVIKNADSDNAPQAPFEHESGELCWDAWICNNPNCPARAQNNGEALIFPAVNEYLRKVYLGEIDEDDPDMEIPQELMEADANATLCPACRAGRQDPTMTDRYQTEEGKQKLKELEEEIKKKIEANS